MRARMVGVLVVVFALVVPAAVAQEYDGGFLRLFPDDGARSDLFGDDVDIDPVFGRIAVGASYAGPGNSGAVYVLEPDAGGYRFDRIEASEIDRGAHFGHSVAIEGDMLVVGAPDDDGFDVSIGAVYVFRRRGERWVEEAILRPDEERLADAVSFFRFESMGNHVDISDGSIIAHAPGNYDHGGSVYVWTRDGGEWGYTRMIGDDSGRNDNFGQNVTVDGDLMVLGAHNHDAEGDGTGAVYIYLRSGDGTWELEQKILPDDAVRNLAFGTGIDVEDGVIAIGAMGDYSSKRQIGRAYVIEETVVGWASTRLPVPDEYRNLGHEVLVHQGRIYVGTYGGYVQATESVGEVLVFEKGPDGWEFVDAIQPPVEDPEFGFSWAMDAANGVLAFGAPGNNPKAYFSGAIWVIGATDPTCADLEPTIWGTMGADEITGTTGPDVIFAGDGDDVILGVGPEDLVCTGYGADVVVADHLTRVADASNIDRLLMAGFRRGAIDLG